MTDMYDEKKVAEFTLPPYQHEDHGSVSHAVPAAAGAAGNTPPHIPPGYGCANQSGGVRDVSLMKSVPCRNEQHSFANRFISFHLGGDLARRK